MFHYVGGLSVNMQKSNVEFLPFIIRRSVEFLHIYLVDIQGVPNNGDKIIQIYSKIIIKILFEQKFDSNRVK